MTSSNWWDAQERYKKKEDDRVGLQMRHCMRHKVYGFRQPLMVITDVTQTIYDETIINQIWFNLPNYATDLFTFNLLRRNT